MKASALGMAGALAGMFATGHLISMADGYNSLNARIKLATTSTDDFTHAQQELMRISQYTGSTFESNAGLFSRVSTSLREYGYSTKDILSLTDALATGLQVSGASAEETSSLIVQLSQALGRGVLRGQDFNSVAQSGQRIMKALSDGLGVAQKDLKQLADAGGLTTPKIVPALISQLQTLRNEYDTMPNSVSAASTRITNAFQQWIGEANKTTAVTATLSGAMDGIARNIDTVATAGMVAAGLFGARALGNRVSAIKASTSALIQNTKAEINNANQAYHNSRIQVENARATERQTQRNVLAARSALLRTTNAQQFAAAQSRLNRTIEAQAKAHAIVTQSIAARKAAQERLNAVTSAGRRMGGALLGVIGGIPGLLMLGAGAAYMLYQNHKAAHEEALAYANTIDTIKDKLESLSLIQLDEETEKTKSSVEALRDELNGLKKDLEVKESQLRSAKFLANSSPQQALRYGQSSAYFKGTAAGIEKAVLVLREKINEKEAKSIKLNEMLVALQEKLKSKVDETLTASKNSQYSTERVVAEFYKIPSVTEKINNGLSFGVTKLDSAAASALVFADNMGAVSSNAMAAVNRINLLINAMKAPELSSSQSSMMDKQVDRLELSKYAGREKQQKQLELDAKNNNLPTPYADSYVKMGMQAYDNEEAARKRESEAREAASEAESAARKAAKVVEDYRNKVAELNTQLATEAVRYKEGSAAAELFSASMQSGKNFTKEQNDEIGRLNKTLEEAKQKYQDLQDAISNDPFRSTAESAKKAREQLERQFKNKDVTPEGYERRKEDIWKEETRGNANARQQYAVSARDDLRGEVDPVQDLDNQLAHKKALYQSYADATIISEQRKNELVLAAETDNNTKRIEAAKQLFAAQSTYHAVAINLFDTVSERMGNMITGLLTGTKSLKEGVSEMFASMAQSVVQSLMKIAANKAFEMLASSFGGGAGGAFNGFMSMFVKNAKGGVYNSPSLSSYSGQIVNSPTLFAFAKGAGLMGEAGPEAIMPLTRSADGSLGVRAITPKGLGSRDNTVINIYITDGKTDSSASKGTSDAFGRRFAQAVAQVYYAERDKDLRQGGAISKAIRKK
ncbi:tape measure protein [Xenorhabdus koppenhoeferi]|uniref:tape measure protein n=1 Tax=Xenorhabdus koppenhoeferi TaxID=351659 RepID=UPI002B40CA6D|nr:tape measure protein [Xenorhabdus sp. Vera]